MKYGKLEMDCTHEKSDHISFDTAFGQLGIDVFNLEMADEINTGVVLNKEQVKELVAFLQECLGE